MSKLATLSLERQPAFDVIDVTAGTWLEAVCHGRDWHQSYDTPRVRYAFRVLAGTCTSWPTPRQFLDVLPARVERTEATKLVSPEEIQRSEESRAKISAMLDELARKLGTMP